MITNILEYILWGFLVVPGPFLLPMIAFFCFRRRVQLPQRMFFAGVATLLIFFICIAIPFYFQGYSQLTSSSEKPPVLGWITLPFISTFAYAYTWWNWGFAWLLVGLLSVVVGDASENKIINLTAKVLICSIYAYFINDLDKYCDTINSALE